MLMLDRRVRTRRFEEVAAPVVIFVRFEQAGAARLREAGLPVDSLSMGMSGDLEAAVAEGATIVRVGTALFGRRG